MKKRMLALVVFGTLLTFTLSLAYAPPASADLKAVVDAICDAYSNTIVATFGSPTPPTFGFPANGFGVGADCGAFMIFMDQNKWHVIHDMRTGGAWFDSSTTALSVCRNATTGRACFELIFLHD